MIVKVRKIKMLVVAVMISLNLAIAQVTFADSNPLFVTITSEYCSSCQKLKPVLEELENEYSGQVTFLTFDVSSKSSLEDAKQTADAHGITKFFEDNKGLVPRVGIICPG